MSRGTPDRRAASTSDTLKLLGGRATGLKKSSSAQKSQGAVWRPRFRTPRASCAQTAHHTRVPRGSCCGTFAAGRKPRRGSSRCAAVRRAGAWPLRYTIHIGSAASGMYSREVVGWSERHACARSAGPRARRHGTGAVPHRPTRSCAHGPGAEARPPGPRGARRRCSAFAPMACPAELEVPDLGALAAPLAPADLPDQLFTEADAYRDRLQQRQQALAANNAIVDPAVDRQIKQRLAACTLAPYLPS